MKPSGGEKVEAFDLSQTVELLGIPDWHIRSQASATLRNAGKEALDVLIAGLSHPNWRVRKECADLMDHLADDRCVEPLLRLLQDPVAAVRRLALHALGCQRCKACPLDVDIVSHLISSATKDKSIQVRRVAIHLLGCQPLDARACLALEMILTQTTDPKLRSRAQWALQQHRDMPSLIEVVPAKSDSSG